MGTGASYLRELILHSYVPTIHSTYHNANAECFYIHSSSSRPLWRHPHGPQLCGLYQRLNYCNITCEFVIAIRSGTVFGGRG